MKEICETCKWYRCKASEPFIGYCYRYPPMALNHREVYEEDYPDTPNCWCGPVVTQDDYCGEWKQRTQGDTR